MGAYAWDSSKAGQIAEGVRIGSVEVGGLSEHEATKRLKAELVRPVERPITVTYANEEFTLAAADLEVRADTEGMVTEALAASRQDDLPSRLVRYVTQDEIEHQVVADVAYSRTAVERFVSAVAAKLNREAENATITPTASRLETSPGKEGAALRAEELRREIIEALEGEGDRKIRADVETVEPEISEADLAAENPDYIVVDRANFTLRHFENLKLSNEYTVAIGQEGYDTPTGLYAIQSMQVDPTWYVPEAKWAGDLAGTTVPPGPDNPLKARWMGFDGGAGIHGTADEASLGSAASHGCVRMAVADVKKLYELVSVGTPVYID
ncbi:MAG: L,D-transpeptidase family protein [Solirubrobacterales bacterium]